MPFISNTDQQCEEMLKTIGVSSADALFSDVPQELLAGEMNIPAGKSEMQVVADLQKLADKNANNLICFLGGGFYLSLIHI